MQMFSQRLRILDPRTPVWTNAPGFTWQADRYSVAVRGEGTTLILWGGTLPCGEVCAQWRRDRHEPTLTKKNPGS